VFSRVCCLPDGRSAVFIGLPEAGARRSRSIRRLTAMRSCPPTRCRSSRNSDDDLFAAVKAGAAAEDDSHGYALYQDPATLADLLKLMGWTRAHTALVLKVLAESANAEQRADAAAALGYAARSPEQTAALVSASFDSDDGVRNNAVRALEVRCTLGAEVTGQVPAARFIPLLHSQSWMDCNKGAAWFVRLTAGRDPALLKMLPDQALEPLREMAQWKDFNHAWNCLTIPGRMSGMEESRLEKSNPSMVEEILRAAQ
jgi:hypothetical protein